MPQMESATLRTLSPATHWPAVLAAALCGIAVAMNVGKVAIALPELRAEFDLSLVAAGWVSSMISAMAVSCALLFGLLGDRVGALRLCLLGLMASLAGSGLALFAGSATMLLVSRFLEGAGMVAVAVSAPALLSAASHPGDRRFALGIWSSYLPGGVGLIMLVAPLADSAGGWRAVWGVAMLGMLAAAGSVWLLRPAYRGAAPGPVQAHPLAGAKQALARSMPWLLAVTMASWTVQHYALIIWLPTFLQEQRALDTQTVALLSCLMVLVNVPGNLIGGALLQRHFPRGGLIAGASLVTGLSGAGIFLDILPDLARYGLCLLLSFVGGLIPASVLSASATLARAPNQIGTLQGLFMQFGNLGPFVGPPLIAMLVASSGLWRDALFVTGSAAALGVALGLAILRQERGR